MSEKPERKIEIGIRIGADSIDDARIALQGIIHELRTVQYSTWKISGGPGCGYSMVCAVSNNQNGVDSEEYFDRLDKWLKGKESDSE